MWKQSLLKNGMLILIVPIYFISWNLSSKFYGFEYEDSFINSFIASQDEYFNYIDNFRTEGCESYVDGRCVKTTSFTGHYLPYSLFLYSINLIINVPNHCIHKVGNFILIALSFAILLKTFKHIHFTDILLLLSICASLPFIYVFNSSLIENLSFFFGVSIISMTYLTKYRFCNYKFLIILFIGIIALVKRENIIYIFLLPIVINNKDFKNLKLYIPLIFLILTQALLNPFYTEFLESDYLKAPTFSIEYLKFQLPTYLMSLISFKGFLTMVFIVFGFSKFNKTSIYLLFLFVGFILLYSTHYRSQYAIIAERIAIFDTYRYLVNTMPIMIGIYLFSKKRKVDKLLEYGSCLLLIAVTFSSIRNFKQFKADEYYNYHSINSKLNGSLNGSKRTIIVDNFSLISILNSRTNCDVFELN